MTTATALARLLGLVIIDAASVADFLALGLPSLLAPGNLPALLPRLRLRITGEPAALAALRRAPAMSGVLERFAPEFVSSAAAPDSWAAELADREIRGMPVLRLDPRVVWSDGGLSAVAAALDAGAARVMTICLPIATEVLRAALSQSNTPPTPGFLARLVTNEVNNPKADGPKPGGPRRRANARQQPGSDLYRRVGPSRFAVHTADWDIVGAIAGGRERPVAFLDDPTRALALRLGHRAAPARAALIRQLAASRPARQRFRRRVELGEGTPVAAELAALDHDLDEIEAAVGAALAKVPRHLLIAAWTRPYVELCLRMTLPSLMSPGNLARLEPRDKRMPTTLLCALGGSADLRAIADFSGVRPAKGD